MSRVKKSTEKSTPSLLSAGGAPRRRGVAKWITTLAVRVLTASLLASPVMAQQETEVNNQSQDYPAGPPYNVRTENPFPYRDLRNELPNKMTGTYTVASTGDVFWRFPVAQRMSPHLRDLLRNADTTVGNLEGGMGGYPQDRAKDLADLGFDLLGPGEDDSVAGYEARA